MAKYDHVHVVLDPEENAYAFITKVVKTLREHNISASAATLYVDAAFGKPMEETLDITREWVSVGRDVVEEVTPPPAPKVKEAPRARKKSSRKSATSSPVLDEYPEGE